MPEMLTKYPDSALAVLKSAGAKCGVGIQPHILTKCPTQYFCQLPQGEICVYPLKDAAKMTQIIPGDFNDVIKSVPSIYSDFNIILLVICCLFGMMIGILLKK